MPVAFISHAAIDKPLVEPYAIAAADAVGRDNVFYDSWSVQPGDGIVAGMNDALDRATHFFLFMTDSSLTSEMVALEWQSAVFKRVARQLRLVPVRLDGATPPALLLQLRYIDAFAQGEAFAIEEMRRVLEAEEIFQATPAIENLQARVAPESGSTVVTISARAYMEPNPSFAVFVAGSATDVEVTAPSEQMYGFNRGGGALPDGAPTECVHIDKQSPLTPNRPLVVRLRRPAGDAVDVLGVVVERTIGRGTFIPLHQHG